MFFHEGTYLDTQLPFLARDEMSQSIYLRVFPFQQAGGAGGGGGGGGRGGVNYLNIGAFS